MSAEKSADKMMKKAEKSLQPSILSMRFKPEWDEACHLFEQAALQYKVAGVLDKAVPAYEKAAEAHTRGGGTAWHAAKHLETAAQISCDLKNWGAASEFVRRASQHYVECGKVATGAECLGRGARWLEQHDTAQAAKLYKEAVHLYSQDDQAQMAQDVVHRGVAVLVRDSVWDDAVELLMRWATICNDHENGLLGRAYLSVLVIHLYSGHARSAWAAYQDFLDVETFANAKEAYAAEDLLQAYASGSATLVRKRITDSHTWSALDAQVARLAKQLPSDIASFEEMSAFLASRMVEDGGNDKTQAEEDLDLT